MEKLNWKKGIFSSKYRLFENNIEVGAFSKSAFSGISIGKIKEAEFKFKKKGIFSSETEIKDLNLNQPIGCIKFNRWGHNAEIKINDKKYLWKYDNLWRSKWSISENGQQLINYKSATTAGTVESLIENDLLLLSGFYVYNYYVMLMIIIAASTTIIVSGN